MIAIEDHNRQLSTHRHRAEPVSGRVGYEDSYEDEIDIADILKVVSHNKLLIAGITLAVFALALIYTISLTPIYRATATIKIDTEADKLAQYEGVLAEKRINLRTFHETQYELIKSRVLAKRVIEKLELEEKFQEHRKLSPFYTDTIDKVRSFFLSLVGAVTEPVIEAVANKNTEEFAKKVGKMPTEIQFIENLTITPADKSNVVQIHYDSPDPELAAAALNTLVNQYIEMNLEGMTASTAYAKQYLTEQIALAKSRLESSEAELVKYAKEKQIIKTDSQNSLVSNTLDVLNQAYAEAQKELIEAESEYRQRNKVSGDIRILDNVVIQELKKKRSELESRYMQQLEIYKPAFPAMIELKNQINETQRQIRVELEGIQRNSRDDLESRYYAAREKERALAKKLELNKVELLALRDKSIGYSTMQREVETNRQLYDNLLQRMKEVGVAGGVVSNNISIVDPAFVPYGKHKPDTKRNLLIGTTLGLILGLGVAFVREKFDDRIRSVKELESFSDLPVLGIFPYIKKKTAKSRKEIIDAAVILEDRNSMEAEAFRSLVNNLGYVDSDGLPKILHITSASPSEGKSNTAINAGIVIAENKKKVLLIDADLRKPKVDLYLKAKHHSGLTDYLVGKKEVEDILTHSSQPGLDLITAGTPAPAPPQLLADERMLDLLEFAASEYDHVIIDSPPVLGLADALILANRASATLFVVASHETRRAHITDALKRLYLGYANVAGFVLTKAKSTKNTYYSYDNYYGYKHDEPALKIELKKRDRDKAVG